MIGLDTSAVIDLFKGNESLKNLMLKINEDISLNYLSYFELLLGIDLDKEKEARELEYYNSFFEQSVVFGINKNSMIKASQIYRNLKMKGQLIEHFDCLIAGIFLSNNINTILTRNKKHFERIKELKVISY